MFYTQSTRIRIWKCYKSIEPTNTVNRQTSLEWFFKTDREAEIANIEIDEEVQTHILNYQNINTVDPMIGMEGIKPTDFL